MKELTKELMVEVKEGYKKYKLLMSGSKELTAHNKDMKDAFMGRHFGEDSAIDPSESKRIKKEVTKLINSIMEIDAGTEPLSEIKTVRAEHLDFEDYIYEDLMTVFKQIVGNNSAKEDLTGNPLTFSWRIIIVNDTERKLLTDVVGAGCK